MNMIYLLVFFHVCVVYGEFYDSYKGTPIGSEEYYQHVKANTTFWCVSEILPCDPQEWRRLDGSCNNLYQPTSGAPHTPTYRILPPAFEHDGKDFVPRSSKSGKPLPLIRKLRTSLLANARVPDQTLTMLSSHFLVFIASDVSNLHDTVNYVMWTPGCCNPGNRNKDMCAPIEVPADDPVHQFSGIRCFNLTKPMTFQSNGCRKKGTKPERILTATPLVDLSTIYGNLGNPSRSLKGGLLNVEVEDGITWPPSEKTNRGICLLNQRPRETRCHKTPADEMNTLMSINLMSIWFWRYHNYIADRLAEVNPCWNDEKLFYTARDINIAVVNQILYYELLPLMMGYDNLVNAGVISQSYDFGFRDIYDPSFKPEISIEFPIALRWLHTAAETITKMYHPNGTFIKQVRGVDIMLRTGYLAVDNNLEYITQGSFRQPSAKIDDHNIDPDLAERTIGPVQRAQDVASSDLAKDRLLFLQPYTKYLKHCFGKDIKTFEDLKDFFEPEMLEKLSELYDDVEDIDLLAAIWSETSVKGGRVPHTFYCIVTDQLLRYMKSDRHWYERRNRPHAFSIEQLYEVRKSSIASVLCAVGDGVSQIQPHAFRRIGPRNEMTSCKNIPQIDIEAWRDSSCNGSKSH
ncbi:peroxidase-like [Anticarsia gemmatalis]|uniref:peroxidase-like n=1 Tax=Anticarsia gemmatalis TaxID=129554 RepID=UPI003F761454